MIISKHLKQTEFSRGNMNKFFYKMKFKYQRYAIKNLAVYASVIFAIGYMLISTPVGADIYSRYLMFTPRDVLHGQIWRIFTAMLYPPFSGGVFNALLGIFIYYSFASAVEQICGEFEFNVYFFGSILIGELGNIAYYLFTGNNFPFIPMFTYFSVFIAFAILYAESTVLLFFIIPIKTKYLAVFELALYTFYFIFGDNLSRIFGIAYTRFAIVAAMIPVYLFYRLIYNGNGSIFSSIRDMINRGKRRREWRDQWK